MADLEEMMEKMQKEVARRGKFDLDTYCPHCASMEKIDISSKVVSGTFWQCRDCGVMWSPVDKGAHYDSGYIRHPFHCASGSSYGQ